MNSYARVVFRRCPSGSGATTTDLATGRRITSASTTCGPRETLLPGRAIAASSSTAATLNPGGVRIGTAEIYRVVEQLPQIVESLVFGQQWEGDTRIVLLVRLSADALLDDALQTEIRARIRSSATPRHVPAVIAKVDDLPRTRSNKLVELAVADIVHGRPVRNTEALVNPEALDAIAALSELRGE